MRTSGSGPWMSTIEQQLIKQLYGNQGGLAGTLREIGLGVKLSISYSKPEILDMYLNPVCTDRDGGGAGRVRMQDAVVGRGVAGRAMRPTRAWRRRFRRRVLARRSRARQGGRR